MVWEGGGVQKLRKGRKEGRGETARVRVESRGKKRGLERG